MARFDTHCDDYDKLIIPRFDGRLLQVAPVVAFAYGTCKRRKIPAKLKMPKSRVL